MLGQQLVGDGQILAIPDLLEVPPDQLLVGLRHRSSSGRGHPSVADLRPGTVTDEAVSREPARIRCGRDARRNDAGAVEAHNHL
jgi:hypothetical protein